MVFFLRWKFDVKAPDISGSWFINLLLKYLYIWSINCPLLILNWIIHNIYKFIPTSYFYLLVYHMCKDLSTLLILTFLLNSYIYNYLFFSTFNNHLGSAYYVLCVVLGVWHITESDIKHLGSLHKSFSLHFWGHISEETKVFCSSLDSALGLLRPPLVLWTIFSQFCGTLGGWYQLVSDCLLTLAS